MQFKALSKVGSTVSKNKIFKAKVSQTPSLTIMASQVDQFSFLSAPRRDAVCQEVAGYLGAVLSVTCPFSYPVDILVFNARKTSIFL